MLTVDKLDRLLIHNKQGIDVGLKPMTRRIAKELTLIIRQRVQHVTAIQLNVQRHAHGLYGDSGHNVHPNVMEESKQDPEPVLLLVMKQRNKEHNVITKIPLLETVHLVTIHMIVVLQSMCHSVLTFVTVLNSKIFVLSTVVFVLMQERDDQLDSIDQLTSNHSILTFSTNWQKTK